jgi:cyclase
MANRTLIVARFDPANAGAVAEAFAASDATELPHRIGVTRRTLMQFHNLYFHLIESDDNIGPALREHRDHPLFKQVDTALAEYVKPYDPNWRQPSDAMAKPFYTWSA